jgi:phosphate starvation-inducible PhoH-like protein
MSKKRSKIQEMQVALNEFEEIQADKKRELLKMNFKIRAKYKNKKQKEMAEIIKKNRITFVEGCAGTGKSLIGIKTGLEILKNPEEYNISSIMFTKPIVQVSNDRIIGALPGDLMEKISKYFDSLYANLEKLVEKPVGDFLKKMFIKDRIINFMRGDTFGDVDEEGNPTGVYCILDEGQNTTINEMKTYISRLGEYSKIIVLYDPDQIDIKLGKNEKCGAVDAVDRLKDLEGIGYIKFDEDDIVRDPFLIEIMKRYR